MSKGFDLDFNGFLDLAEDISNIDNNLLLEATKKALDVSREMVNVEVGKAMKSSKFSFRKGEGYSQGTARESLVEVSKMPVEVNGTEVVAYAGVNLEKAPEVLILALEGSPHQAADTKLKQAVQVKWRIRKNIQATQSRIFHQALEEAMRHD